MSTQTITLRKVDVLSDEDINSRKDWLSARQRLLNRAQDLRRVRVVSQMLRVSSAGSYWCSPDRGGVFASPTPQTAGLVAELFATERDCFHPL